jgi:phage I-like protein
MLTPIFNREKFQPPADGWFPLAPKGEHPVDLDGQTYIQVIDDVAIEAMAKSLPPGKELLIDFDHFSHDSTKSSVAGGWINKLQARPDGLYFQARWTGTGQASLEKGDFRFISPTWLNDPSQVEYLGNNRIRPRVVNDAGLTNSPNLRGLKPLTNRGQVPAPNADGDNQSATKPRMKALLNRLGLSPDANEDSAVTAVTELKNRATTAEGQVAALTTELNAARAELTTLREAAAEADLARFANRISDDSKPTWKASLIANRAGTIALLESIKPAAVPAPITNRATAGTPNTTDAEFKPTDPAKAAAIQNRATELRSLNPKLTIERSYAQAKAELEKA